jgi:hypothetical protein
MVPSIKYMFLKPNIAKILEVIAMNELVVIDSTVGIESNAKTRSVISIIISEKRIGVAYTTPSIRENNLLPLKNR